MHSRGPPAAPRKHLPDAALVLATSPLPPPHPPAQAEGPLGAAALPPALCPDSKQWAHLHTGLEETADGSGYCKLNLIPSWLVYPRCAVAHQEWCFYQFWFIVPFLAEMAHQSPYRTGVLALIDMSKCGIPGNWHKWFPTCRFWHRRLFAQSLHPWRPPPPLGF